MSPAAVSQPWLPLLPAYEALQAGGEQGCIAWFHQKPLELAREDLGNAPDPRGEDRPARGESLDDHSPERLSPERRDDHHIGRMQGQHDKMCIRDRRSAMDRLRGLAPSG